MVNYITHNGSEHAAVTDLPSKYCLFLVAIHLTCKDLAYSSQLYFTVLLTKVTGHVLPLYVCNFTSYYVRHHLPYLSSCERRLEHSTLIHSSSVVSRPRPDRLQACPRASMPVCFPPFPFRAWGFRLVIGCSGESERQGRHPVFSLWVLVLH